LIDYPRLIVFCNELQAAYLEATDSTVGVLRLKLKIERFFVVDKPMKVGLLAVLNAT